MERKNNNTLYALLLVIVALIGAVAYLYITKNKTEMELVSVMDEREGLEKELAQMENQLNEANNSVSKLTEDLKVKDSELKTKIDELKAALKRGDLTAAKLADARNEIDQLRYYVKKYQGEIEVLKQENERLTTENSGLKVTVEEEQKKSSVLTDENVRLSNKVAVAAMLKMSSVKVVPVRYKPSGEEIESSRAKNTQRVRFNFKFAENNIADQGEKVVYLRVINPAGGQEVVTDETESKFRADGQEMQYTSKGTINFSNNKELQYSVYWSKGSTYDKGVHKALLYCDGSLVGSANFDLR